MTHKAILIDPTNRTVTEVDQEDGLKAIYERLSCEGFRPCDDINAVRVSDRDAMYVDGEGLLIPGLPMFSFVGSPGSTFAGKGVIVGTNNMGDDVSHNLSVDKLREAVVWLELETTGEIGPGGFIDPRSVETPFGTMDFVYAVGAPVLKDKDER